MKASTAMVVSKSFTKETADEFGAVKGANCQISSISFDADENTVIDFLWVNTAGKTISDTAIIKKGNKGDKGNGIKELKFNADGKLVAVLDDGTETTPIVMPSTKVDISKETGNVIEEKTDGLYVGATGVEISKDTDNAIETKSDGLYVKKTNSAEISKKADNIIKQETDGLYVPKADAQVQADFNQTDATKADFIKNKPTVDQTYSATSENAQSGKAVASAIATEIGKLTYLSKEIATKAEIDSYVADPTKAKFNTIYLLKDASAKGSDKYFEYQRIGDATTSTFEQTGDTSTDLTDYAKSEDVVAIQQKTEDAGKALIVGVDGKVVPTEISTNTSMVEKAIVDNWNGNGYNLIPYPYAYRDSYENNGIIWTVNADKSITANGTATANSLYRPIVYTNGLHLVKGKNYRLSGCPSGGTSSTYFARLSSYTSTGSGTTVATDIGNGTTTLINTDAYSYAVLLQINSGQTVSNLTFYPMLVEVNEDGSYPTEYQRYASGNVELTDRINETDTRLDTLSYNEIAGGKNLANDILFDESKYILRDTTWSYIDVSDILARKKFTASMKDNPNLSELNCGFGTNSTVDPVVANRFITGGNIKSVTYDFSASDKVYLFVATAGGYISTKLNKMLKALSTRLQVEIGDSATNYVPFIKSNATLTDEISQKELELVELKMLGWTVPKECPIQNEVNGNQFIQKVGRIDLGALSYNKVQNGLFTTKIDDILGSASVGQHCNAYCESYKVVAWENYEVMSDMTMQIRISTDVYIQNSAYTDASAFKSAIQGQYLYYELANSKTITTDGSEIANQMMDIKMLGWSVPTESPIKNSVNGNTFIQRVGRVDLGALNWGINAYATPTAFSLHENVDLPDLVSVSDNKDEKVRCYSPNYDSDSASKVTGTTRTYTFCVITGKRLYVRADVTTAEELKAELKGKYIYYELETPITKQIDGNEQNSVIDLTSEITYTEYKKTVYDTQQLTMCGKTVCFNINMTSVAKPSARFSHLATLPVEARPTLSKAINTTTNSGKPCYVYINPNGAVAFQLNSTEYLTEEEGIRCCFTYIV